MIKINLLSPDLIKKEERHEFIFIAYAIVFFAVVAAGADYAVKYRSFKILELRVTQSERELSKYESIQKQVEALQSAKNILETKKSVINSLMLGRLTYVSFMEKILEVIPNNLWFKSITTLAATDQSVSVTMDAEALDNYAIADFISALSQNKNFSNVELGAITTSVSAKIPTSLFKLKFVYKNKS